VIKIDKKKSNKKNFVKFNKKKDDFKPKNIDAICLGMNIEGKGLIKIDDEIVQVPYLIKGEKAKVNVSKEKRYYKTKILSLMERSKDRVDPKCEYFYDCGGCQLSHMNYESQLRFKEDTVRNLLKPFIKLDGIIGMDNPYEYRNKIHSTFATIKGNEIVSGIYEEYSHKVIPLEKCIIQDPKGDEILKTIRGLVKRYKLKTYDEDKKEGFLRHVLIRTGFISGQILVTFIVTDKIFPSKNGFIKDLVLAHPEITTITMNINPKDTTFVIGEKEHVLFGEGFIEDELCDLRFKISSKSFYQINPIQTEKLYKKAIEFADLKGNETVLDAYCGIGTISLVAAKGAKEVLGIELNKDSVENAITNARMNKIKNVRFINEDATRVMVDIAKHKEKVDVVFMDPPRSGADERFIKAVTTLKPNKVVYISCNPVTLARDLEAFVKDGYTVEKAVAVDMFAQTYHVEAIILMTRSGSGDKK
jgi:23S rRNA (uracil1939-C5)-methyltransferase